MTDESVGQNSSNNPDPREKPVSGDDITPSQEQHPLPDRLQKILIEWLTRINQRYLALNQEKTNDSKFTELTERVERFHLQRLGRLQIK